MMKLLIIFYFLIASVHALTLEDVKKKASEKGGASLSFRECKLVGSKFSNFDTSGKPHTDKGFHCAFVSESYNNKITKARIAKTKNYQARKEQARIAKAKKIKQGKLDAIKQKKAKAEYEKKAKIKKGKQYLCTDGYDTWVLKYNGKRVSYGGVNLWNKYHDKRVSYDGVNLLKTFFRLYDEFGNLRLRINRANGTVIFDGNKATCKPR